MRLIVVGHGSTFPDNAGRSLAREHSRVAGVYAFYRQKEPVYVGKGSSLRQRIWKNHCGRGAVLTGSALRRNIAEHLRIASSADIKARRYQPTPDEVSAVRDWLVSCEVAWIECESEEAAEQLEAKFKAEYMPPLTKQ